MTKEELDKLKQYKDYPNDSPLRYWYDSYFLPYNEYLKKYYSNPEFTEWLSWYPRYIEPAFDEKRHEEMIKNFGYTSKDMFDFNAQYEVYSQLKDDCRLDDDIKKFIGFLAGAGFFKRNNLTLQQWFNIKNWHNPNVKNDDDKTLNEILSYPYGVNYFKILLTQMPFWRR